MKRALCLLVPLVLAAACSHGTTKAGPTPTPTGSPSPTATQAVTPISPPTPSTHPTTVPVGPAGTKVPTRFRPQSATFISSRTGWALGSSPCPSGKGSCDVIARTRDGGATWLAIPSPKTSPDHLAHIRFADPANGFITGDQLWATHDGGGTWKAVPESQGIGELATSGGRVWVNQNGVVKSAAVTGGAFTTTRNAFRAQDLRVRGAVVVTSDTNGRLYRLVQGGFTVVRTPCQGGQVPVAGLGSGHWLLVCAGDAGLGHEEKHAFRSTDSGSTWTPAGDPPQQSGTDSYVTSDGDFVVDHLEVAVSRSGSWQVALSTDGGVSEGGFESADLGYCIGGFGGSTDQTMKITHDAGRTWKSVAF
ncbi:MAG: hypothetical protein QOG99_32 [Frankiales bacterium]|nr:hypothetical protein [Frankiales bacterium]